MAKKIDQTKRMFNLPKLDASKNIFDFWSEQAKYYNILFEIYATQIEWQGLPKEIIRDGGELVIEKLLCSEGKCLFFKDKILDEFLVASFTGSGLNFYGEPTKFTVTAPNGYHKVFDREDCVPIYNSPFFTSEVNTIKNYASKLALCDLTAMLNVNTQKLPYLIKCTQGQRLTLLNLMKELDEFKPKVFVDESFDDTSIKVFPLNSPFVADKLYDLKAKYWGEALKYCGISTGAVKKERVGEEEQKDAQDESSAMLNTRMVPRKIAAKQIKEKFGIELTPVLRKDGDSDGEIHNGITTTEK